MRFLVDNSLSWRLAEWLRGEAHDALHVREIGMEDADDLAIYNHACDESRIVVAQDVDFSTLLWQDPHHRACVILFRLNDGRFSTQKLRLADVLARFSAELIPGTIVVLTDRATRIRRF